MSRDAVSRDEQELYAVLSWSADHSYDKIFDASVATMNDNGVDFNLDPHHPIHVVVAVQAMNQAIIPLTYNTPDRWQDAINYYDSMAIKYLTEETRSDWLQHRRLLVRGKATAVLFSEMNITEDSLPMSSKEVKAPRSFNAKRYLDEIKDVFARNETAAYGTLEDEQRKSQKELLIYTDVIQGSGKSATVRTGDVFDIVSADSFESGVLSRMQLFMSRLRKEAGPLPGIGDLRHSSSSSSASASFSNTPHAAAKARPAQEGSTELSVRAAITSVKQKSDAADPLALALGVSDSSRRKSTGKRGRSDMDDDDDDDDDDDGEARTQPQKQPSAARSRPGASKFTDPNKKGERVPTIDEDEEEEEVDEEEEEEEEEGGGRTGVERMRDSVKGGKAAHRFPPELTSPKAGKAGTGSSSSSSSSSSAPAKKAGPRVRRMWTFEEEDALRQGYEIYGDKGGNTWANIRNDNRFSTILSARTNVDLKDKMRNMSK